MSRLVTSVSVSLNQFALGKHQHDDKPHHQEGDMRGAWSDKAVEGLGYVTYDHMYQGRGRSGGWGWFLSI